MLNSNLPSIDLHGLDQINAVIKTNDFIDDNIILKNKKIKIIHGVGENILKKRIHKELSMNKKVKDYYQTFDNIGVTIVEL